MLRIHFVLFHEASIFFSYLFSEVICIFVFLGISRYNILKIYNASLDNVPHFPSYIEFVLSTVFYGKDNMLIFLLR